MTDEDEFVYPLLKFTGKIGKILAMKDIRNYVDKKLAEKHEQYLIGVINDHDNELAKEICYLFCC